MRNFDYVQSAEPETEELGGLYVELCRKLEQAEAFYWSEPKRCGMMLREAAETICQIYNCCFAVGFPTDTLLENYLCYTGNEEHNRMVSRFLSVIRREQRDRLEWLRVWGDECISMAEMPENSDKLYLNVKKMMVHMIMVTKEMCEKINHMEGLSGRKFDETVLPGYIAPTERERREKEQEKENKKSKLGFFKRK